MTMTEPLDPDRLAEIVRHDGSFETVRNVLGPNSAETHRHELIAEVKRLNDRLTDFIGWEPTVKEEYEHACEQADKVSETVREFKRAHPDLWSGPDQNEAVTALIAGLERALEVY